MIGDDTDKLYTLDTVDGTATPVGTTAGFGASEIRPAALASHRGSLYMTGNTNNRLYTLNTADGTATPVGATAGFGVGESLGHGIATGYSMPSDFTINATTGAITYTGASATAGREHTLYARVSDGRAADNTASTAADDTVAVTVEVVNLAPSFNADSYSFTVTPDSDGSTPVSVGTLQATDPEGQTLAYSLRAPDPGDRMYMTSSVTNALYTLNSTTGEAARVGTVNRFGVGEVIPSGMAWHNGRLYMAGYYTNSLYTLDIDTGEAALIATGAQITGRGGPTRILVGVASHNGELYTTTAVTGRLYRVDLDTLTGTQIGVDDFGDIKETRPYDIASHGSPRHALHDRNRHRKALHAQHRRRHRHPRRQDRQFRHGQRDLPGRSHLPWR